MKSLVIKTLLFFGIGIVFILPLVTHPAYFSGTDLGAWGGDWGKFSRCLESGWVPCLEISKFPATYLMNSYLLDAMSAHGITSEQSLLLINTTFLGLPILFFITVRGIAFALPATLIYCSALLLSALPVFYIYSGALEVQAGVIIGLFISSVLLIYEGRVDNKNHVLNIFLVLSAVIFPLYKDTAFVVVVCSLLLVFFIMRFAYKKRSALTMRNHLHIVVSLMFSLAVLFGYNFIKYKSIAPIEYLREAALSAPSISKSFEFLLASILSPNGGVLTFWFAAFFAAISLTKWFGMTLSRVAILVSVTLSFASVVSFSLWWVPFGWDSWGNRLMVPAMLASLISIVATADLNLGALKNQNNFFSGLHKNFSLLVFRKVLSVIVVMLLLILSLHYTLVSYYAEKATLIRASLFGGTACTHMMTSLRTDGARLGMSFWRSDDYYDCARERFLHFPTFSEQAK